MQHRWVNQNQTYLHEIGGGYLWPPRVNSNGACNCLYDAMKATRLGNVVFMGMGEPAPNLDAVLDVPVVYASGRNGAASWNKPENGSLPDNDDLEPLFDAILKHIPAPTYDDEHPLQAHVTHLDASPFLGPLGRVEERRTCPDGGQGIHLILHQGDEWRDDDARALTHERGNLVAQRLAAAGRHQHQRVAATGNAVDDFSLRAAERRVAEDVAQDLQRLHLIHI